PVLFFCRFSQNPKSRKRIRIDTQGLLGSGTGPAEIAALQILFRLSQAARFTPAIDKFRSGGEDKKTQGKAAGESEHQGGAAAEPKGRTRRMNRFAAATTARPPQGRCHRNSIRT